MDTVSVAEAIEAVPPNVQSVLGPDNITINANRPIALQIDPADGTGFKNSGTMQASGGGILRFVSGPVTNTLGSTR